jgi:putative PIN family toxin of toxin-antitoxin system
MTMSNSRFVLDTNLIVSALLLKQSVARQALDKALTEGKLLLSLATLEELNTVLKRDKFNKYLLEEERVQFLIQLMQQAIMVEVTETIVDCRDPKDNKFLELAISGKADCIVSGDEDLTSLHPFREIPILTPRVFLDHQWKDDL